MALTYRQTKGSALTIQELDANFAFFTGSHSISGSSTLPVIISGSLEVTGSFGVNSGPVNMTGTSFIITGLPTSEPATSGSLWLSGSTATGGSALLAVKV
jgi:hypothetical protein|tara:strand:+ start:219 stop:518 length:300 start_codon:yes stop_codon:yes gene_type:complete